MTDKFYLGNQQVEPQPLTDLQENTRTTRRLVFAAWVAIGLGLIFLLFWAYTWYYFDKHNILWNIISNCGGVI